jgi:glycosyltransferase involved in cell wall biosynthesis
MNLLVFNLVMDTLHPVLGFTTDWVNELASRVDRVEVVTMQAGRIEVRSNVRVTSVGRELGYSKPRRTFEFYRVLDGVLRETRIDACFAHMMPLFCAMSWPVLRSRVPRVLWYAHRQVSPTLRLATLAADRVVSASPSSFRIATPKLRIVGHGIDTKRFRPDPRPRSGPFRLLTAGRISKIKRVELLLSAIERLPAELRARTNLDCVGSPLTSDDHRYAAELAELVKRRGLEERVRIRAALPFSEMPELYREADIFLNTSDTDSIDKSPLEAMSSGLPIVTTNSSFREILPAHLADDLVSPKGDAAALAARIERLLTLSESSSTALRSELRMLVERDHSLPRLCDIVLEELTRLRARVGEPGKRGG